MTGRFPVVKTLLKIADRSVQFAPFVGTSPHDEVDIGAKLRREMVAATFEATQPEI